MNEQDVSISCCINFNTYFWHVTFNILLAKNKSIGIKLISVSCSYTLIWQFDKLLPNLEGLFGDILFKIQAIMAHFKFTWRSLGKHNNLCVILYQAACYGLPWWVSGKSAMQEPQNPQVRRSPGGGHRNPLQYFCLENPMNRGAWWATVHRVAQSWTQMK